MKVVCTTVSEDVLAKIDLIAKEKFKSRRTHVISEAIQLYLKERELNQVD